MRVHIALGVVAAILLTGLHARAQDKPAEKRTVGKDGKVMVEKKTPFGTAKYEEKPAEKSEPAKNDKAAVEKKTPFGTARVPESSGAAGAEAPPNIQAVEEGDTVRFEARTPFGVSKWTKKKTELNETEKAALARQQKKPAKP